MNFSVEGGEQEIKITANFEYEVKSNADWLTLEKNENGIKVTVPNYYEVESRIADITLSNEKYKVSRTIVISQGAFVPEITIEPKEISFQTEGGEQDIAITANFEYSSSADVDWITLEKNEKGIKVTVEKQVVSGERSAEMTISNEKYAISHIVKVSQNTLNAIFYQSSNNEIVNPISNTFNDYATPLQTFGANIISNTYENGKGIIIFDAPVTSIGNYAFYHCGSLTSVTIPDSVTSIGYAAFYYCSSLTAFYGKFASADNRCLIIDGVLHSFAPAGLTEYSIPDSTTSIGKKAFANCFNLTSVTIPDSVISIEEHAFLDCDGLTSITIPNSVTWIGGQAFYACSNLISVYCRASIPPILGNIPALVGDCVFIGNADGRTIYVHEECVDLYKSKWSDYADDIVAINTVSTIKYTTSDGNIVQANNLAIKSNTYNNSVGEIVIYGKLTNIPDIAFNDCSTLTSIELPNDIISIGDKAFYGCCNLTSVTIGNGVTSIGYCAFYNCSSLTSVTIPDSTTSLGASAFYGCNNLEYIDIGKGLTEIKYNTFFNCTSLKFILLLYNVTTIGSQAFGNCANIEEVWIGDKCTMISYNAFRNCSNLMHLRLGGNVDKIYDGAFWGCNNLVWIECTSTTPPKIFHSNSSGSAYVPSFPYNQGMVIYVPRTSYDAYTQYSACEEDCMAQTNWSCYKEYIKPYDF